MKSLLIFISLFFSLSFISTQETSAITAEQIAIRGKSQDVQPRSICPVQAWHVGADVYLSFGDSPVEVLISIKDENGEVVTEEVFITPKTVQLSVDGPGNYMIEINYADTYLYGTFDL